MASLSPERRKRIQEKAAKTIQELRAIRELREQLGLTQEEFAERLGMSQSRVSRLELRRRGLTFESFAGIISALGGAWELTVTLPDVGAIKLTGSEDFEKRE